MSRYTLVVTSCNRHDLLERTLRSFCMYAEEEPVETIIIEDGNLEQPAWFKSLGQLGWRRTWIKNEHRQGQIYAIDRAYQAVETELIFHLEDDWEFYAGDFIGRSKQILSANPHVSTVSVRSDNHHPVVQENGLTIQEPYWGGYWGGLTFNPGLRRKSDWTRLGGYGAHVGYGTSGLVHERTLSKQLLDDGNRIVVLTPGVCHHIGGNRSRAIEPLDRPPRILIAVPACERFDYGKWESKSDGSGYGIDIHTSGDNPRALAVRDTWWKDVAPFKSHCDARFFYGTLSRPPLADEILLGHGFDTYESLPRKTQAICRWAFENDYEYLFKCDDDTAVRVDGLVREILENPLFDYAGHINANCCTGGPGYFLGRRAMKTIAHAGNHTHWAEDRWVGEVLWNAGMRPLDLSKTHLSGFSNHWFNIDDVKDDTVTFHAVQPDEMRKWYERTRCS